MRETINVAFDQDLKGVTAEMIDWWWDNLGSTERYKMWHPQDHVSFAWEVLPTACGRVGAIHTLEERIGGVLHERRVRWDDPKAIPFATTYERVLVASVLAPDGSVISRQVCEYENALGGVRCRITWVLPSTDDKDFIDALKQHNIEEMKNLSGFLPEFFSVCQSYLN